MSNKKYIYYVEGDNEEKLINTLKSELKVIKSGKVVKFNITNQKLTNDKLMRLKQNTTVVLVFDVDANNTDILTDNINTLKNCKIINNIVFLMQVNNLEDELVSACNIESPFEITGADSYKMHKRNFNNISNLAEKLLKYDFNIDNL